MTTEAKLLIEHVKRRACQRKTYARIYLVIKATQPCALCDEADGYVLGFTDWEEACRASVPFRGFVTNWDEFARRGIRSSMTPRPDAVRILHTDNKGRVHRFHAEFNASVEELRTLNQMVPRDYKHTPDRVRQKRATARVWEETT